MQDQCQRVRQEAIRKPSGGHQETIRNACVGLRKLAKDLLVAATLGHFAWSQFANASAVERAWLRWFHRRRGRGRRWWWWRRGALSASLAAAIVAAITAASLAAAFAAAV